MSVIETRLSPKAERGFSAIPESSTRIITLNNGHERRNGNWANKRRRYSAQHAAWTQAMRDELLNLIHATEGALYGFLYKDWSDYRVTNQSLGTAPSGTTAVQLAKDYTFGARTHTRTITRPDAATVTVYEDGVAKAGTLDATTGLFTPGTAWAGGAVTWTGEFNVPVRFASDSVEIILVDRDIYEVRCELVEVFGE